ncbi:MAG TPA: phosphopantetheine-binding protein [Streptosporangiaceae bacterium]|nr:phosphopantetheine-binding protein [Streptosporangiaceae bacterium]
MADPAQEALRQTLLATVASLLNLEDVSGSDNFFELGGHSIIAAQMLRMLEPELGYRAPLRHVFESEDLDELAARLSDGLGEAKAVP